MRKKTFSIENHVVFCFFFLLRYNVKCECSKAVSTLVKSCRNYMFVCRRTWLRRVSAVAVNSKYIIYHHTAHTQNILYTFRHFYIIRVDIENTEYTSIDVWTNGHRFKQNYRRIECARWDVRFIWSQLLFLLFCVIKVDK